MRTIFICLLAITCLVVTGCASNFPASNSSCFKPVFKKTSQRYQWQVLECARQNSATEGIYYHVVVKRPDGSVQESGVFAGTPQVQTDYNLLGSELLQLDFVDERNGETAFLHPIVGSGTALSLVRFNYTTGDEESLQVLRKGNQLTFKPISNKMKVNVLPDGKLQLLKP